MNKINLLKSKINKIKLTDKLPVFIFVAFALIFGYSAVKESILTNIQTSYSIPNTTLNSVVVALDGFFNPDGVIAAVEDITKKIQTGEGVLIEDVFRRCKIQSEDRVSKAFFQLYDTKTGVNNGDAVGSGADIREYLRWDNRSSLDLLASQNVLILSDGGNPEDLANAIRKNNEEGFIPVIRLGIADLGVFPFPNLTLNADEMVAYFEKVGESLKKDNKGYRAVISLGPNEPNTGDAAKILASMGVPDYLTMVQRENQAADRLQKYRVQNGGPFWLGPAIFNGTQESPVPERDFAFDIYYHLYVDNGDTNTDNNYFTRQSIDPNLFDVMLVNVYSQTDSTAYDFYKNKGLKEYVDKRPNLVTIVTEFGVVPGFNSIKTADIKDDFKELYDDPKIEGINYFRALKDKPSIPPMPEEDQRVTIEDLIKFTEQSNKTNRKITLKNNSWINCPLPSALYSTSNETSSGGSGNSGVLKPTTKGGLNQADSVGGGQATMDKAKSVGLSGFSLAIAYKPEDAGATISFINDSISRGFTPIIRLCVHEGTPCEFNLSGGNSSDLVQFYNAVAAGASGSFIGILGPNEPLTEMGVFGVSNISEAVQASINAVNNINKNGKLLVSPAAFNLQTPELDAYKTAFESAKFDVLIGNAYNIGGETAEGISGNAIAYAKSKGLKIVITETGTIAGTGAVDFPENVASFCQQVDGFLLFRALPGSADGSYANKPTEYSDDQLKAIAAACSGGASDTNSTTASTDTSTSSTTANSCTGGIPADQIIFLGDSLTNELASKEFAGSQNLGFPGASSAWLVPGAEPGNDKSSNLNTALSDSKYKAIVVMFGTNDCGGVDINVFKQNLTTIVNNIKSRNPDIKIVLSTIPRAHKACSPSVIDGYNVAIREVQSATGVTNRDLGGSIFSEGDLRDGDDRHLNDAAYSKIASITQQALGGSCTTTGDTTAGTSTTTNAGSIALSCGVEDDKPAEFYKGKNAAGLRVVCEGGSCTTKKVGTLEIEAPIKLFSSNSANGTLRLRYIPVSQVAASSSGNQTYDALNMFAGEVKFGAKSYPLPGLGNGINSASQILAETMTDADLNRVTNNSNGSLVEVTGLKLQNQIDNDSTIGVKGISNTGQYSVNTFSIADESGLQSINDRTWCFDGECFNNDSGLADWRKNLLPYDPSIAFPSYIAPKACVSSEMKFINNLDNYITGPELVVESESTVTNNTTSEICWMYSGRNIQSRNPKMSGDQIKTCGYIFTPIVKGKQNIDALSPDNDKPVRRIFETRYDPIIGANVTTSRIEYESWTCKEIFDGVANSSDNVFEESEFANAPVPGGSRLPQCDFDDALYSAAIPVGSIPPAIRSGNCDIPAKYKSCLEYDPQPLDELYIHTESYPPISKVRVPGAYSALYGLYDRLQTIMSSRNMKFVFQENIGMKFKVSTKIRDANESVAQIPYEFSETFDSYSTLPPLVDNDIPLAINNSTKTQFQYFDDLGYLDILQEYIVAYANESVLIGDNAIDNPFSESGLNPLPGRDRIVVGGTSNIALANPVLTCDQVEICKDFTYTDLVSTYGEDMAFALCPLTEKLPADSKRNCITFEDDKRFIDRVETSLCSRGFPVADGCNFQCSEGGSGIDETPTGGNPGEGGPPISGQYGGTACPAADNSHRCFQGPYGSYTHLLSNGLPLDLYPAFTGGSAASGRDKRIVAPEDGVVVGVTNSGSQGSYITFRGKSGLEYRLLHLNGNDPDMVRSGEVQGGQRIAEIATQASVPGLAYDDANIHTHIRAEFNGKDVDPYYLFGEILGCNVKKPDPNWSEGTDITSLVDDPTNYCVKSSGGRFLLNDNNALQSTGTKPAIPDNDTVPISNTVLKGLFDTAYGSPVSAAPKSTVKPITNVVANSNKNSIIASSTPMGPSVLGVDTIGDIPSTGTNGVVSSPDFKIRIPTEATVSETSDYGSRCFIRSGQNYCDLHTGVDYAGNTLEGAPVVAAESGIVTDVGYDTLGYGHYVKILHPNGYATLYAHNSSVSVAKGDCVAIGQEIAIAGTTGNSTGVHIHLEVRKDSTCTISDYTQGSTQSCAINPAPFIDPSKSNTMFTDEEVKNVCDGKIPTGGNNVDDGDNVISCIPTNEDDDGNPTGNTFYKTVFDLLEKVEQVSGVSKYFLAGILSLESGPELNTSVGNAITSGGATYTGDPYDIGNPGQNGASAVGPFQYICRTAASYFFPPGGSSVQWPVSNPSTTCTPWSAGGIGRYYDKVLACVQAIGMDYSNGDILDPKYIGVGACAASVNFSGVAGAPLVDVSSGFSDGNAYWSAAGSYNGGGNWKQFPESVWYANSTWGRTKYFEMFWDDYKSGVKGSDCSRPFREWYYYQVDLGISCISNGYGGQCEVTTPEALDIACNR